MVSNGCKPSKTLAFSPISTLFLARPHIEIVSKFFDAFYAMKKFHLQNSKFASQKTKKTYERVGFIFEKGLDFLSSVLCYCVVALTKKKAQPMKHII